jgi:hypothetical protein
MIEDLITQIQKAGHPPIDDQLLPNDFLWALCSGAAWRDTSERLALGRRLIRALETGEIEAG